MPEATPPPGLPTPVTLLLVDAHDLPRRSQRDWLDAQRAFAVVGDTGNADEAEALARRHRPQVVLVGMRVRGVANGIAMTRRLRALDLGLEVVFLTLFDSPEYVQQALRAGARGYVLKESPASEVLHAIGAALRGDTYIGQGLQGHQPPPPPAGTPEPAP